MSDYESLKDYCKTDKENQTVDILNQGLSQKETASMMGVSTRTIEKRLKRIRDRASLQGWSPNHDMMHPVPDTHYLKGTSTLYDERGDIKLQWVKSNAQMDKMEEFIQASVEAMKEDIEPVEIKDWLGTNLDEDIIPWFNIGDAHIGCLAHDMETGYNNDIPTTERELLTAMFTLIEETPAAKRCVINDLGDATHYETFDGVTMGHGHALDYDTRYPKMISAYVRIMKALVIKASEKFEYVDVIINQGNHSRSNDIFMAELLRSAFDSTDRINVLDNSSVFIPYRMGNTFVLCHHGDKCKSSKIASVMATDFAHDWGESKYRYIWNGHVHHREMLAKEDGGVTVESWNSMSRGDKYAHDGGWRSRSCLSVVRLSKTYGEVGRQTIPIERVIDIVNNSDPGTAAKDSRREVYTV